MTTSRTLFPTWLTELNMQQQTVLVIAGRGPDGVAKYHSCKVIWRHYRATVFKAAWQGRELAIGEGTGNEFMTLELFKAGRDWDMAVRNFFATIDELPHHSVMHLMHGAQILGYKHPSSIMRGIWHQFYLDCVDDMHLRPETEALMDARLSDWNRNHWDE